MVNYEARALKQLRELSHSNADKHTITVCGINAVVNGLLAIAAAIRESK